MGPEIDQKSAKSMRNKESYFGAYLTLLTGPKNTNVKQVLGSILTPTLVLESFLTPAHALKCLSAPRNSFNQLKNNDALHPSGVKIDPRTC